MNVKNYVYTLLTSSNELKSILGDGKILSAYPNEVTTFPTVVFEDSSERDAAYNDNLPNGLISNVRVHVFVKSTKKSPTTWDIGSVIHNIFRVDYWSMNNNREMVEDDSIKHRIMDFSRNFFFG